MHACDSAEYPLEYSSEYPLSTSGVPLEYQTYPVMLNRERPKYPLDYP